MLHYIILFIIVTVRAKQKYTRLLECGEMEILLLVFAMKAAKRKCDLKTNIIKVPSLSSNDAHRNII